VFDATELHCFSTITDWFYWHKWVSCKFCSLLLNGLVLSSFCIQF